jgi:hypothetical protein
MYLSIFELKSGRAVYASKHSQGSPSVCFAHAPLHYRGDEPQVPDSVNGLNEADRNVHMRSQIFPMVYVSRDTQVSLKVMSSYTPYCVCSYTCRTRSQQLMYPFHFRTPRPCPLYPLTMHSIPSYSNKHINNTHKHTHKQLTTHRK